MITIEFNFNLSIHRDLLPPLKWKASFLHWRRYPPEGGYGFKGFSSPIILHFGPGHGTPASAVPAMLPP